MSNNPNITFICADESEIPTIQEIIIYNEYTNCTTSSDCSLLNNNSIESEKKLTIYPNPAKNELFIETNSTEISFITIYNMIGQIIQTIPNAKNTTSIDVSNLKSGSYFIKIVTDNSTISQQFIKE